MSKKTAFFNLAHSDYYEYFDNLCIALADDAIKNLRDKNWEVVGSSKPILNEKEALKAVIGASCEQIDSFVIFIGTWIECSMPMVIIKELEHLPFLIWGFPMLEIDGKREQLGSMVGELVLNGSLKRAGYNFKEIIGFPDDKEVLKSIDSYLCAARAKKILRRSRIGMVGYMSMSMYTATFDHLLMRSYIGPEIVHIDTHTLIERALAVDINQRIKIKEMLFGKNLINKIPQPLADKTAALYYGLKCLLNEYFLDGINVKCQYELSKDFGCTPCVPLSVLSDEGYVCGCEGDIPTQVSMHILKALSGEIPTYVDFLDFKKNNVYLSSCGLAPFSLSNNKNNKKINEFSFDGFNGFVSSTVLKPGTLTLARLSEKIGEYELIYTIGKGLNSTQLRQNIMPAVSVNLKNEVESKINLLSSQHLALVYGDLEEKIIDFVAIMKPYISICKI